MAWSATEWSQDLRHAVRALRRTPGFTVLSVGMLALAIGALAGMFGVVNRVLLDPLPFHEPDRLVHIAGSAPGTDYPEEFGLGPEFLVQYGERSHLLENISTYNSFTSTLRVGDRVERVRMSWPTTSMYATLGVAPMLGRVPTAADGEEVAVISYPLWTSWFGRDSAVIGKSFYISGNMRTVIGVMGPDFRFPDDGTLLWVNGIVRPANIQPGGFGGGLVARLKPGVTLTELATELDGLARQIPERWGAPAGFVKMLEHHHAIVRPLKEQLLGQVSRPLWVLLGSVAIVLLIACANVANLFLVRGEGRQRDLAVRRALGAGRGQLIRLQMAEALVIALLASAMAVVLAGLAFPAFLQAAPEGIPRIDRVHLDASTLGFTLLAAVLAALACGAVPAIRGSAPDLNRLRDGGRGSTRRRHWARNGLVIAQTALALVLLIGSGLLVRSFRALSHVDPGYDTKDLFTFQIAPDRPELHDGPTYANFEFRFMDRLRALPGVQSVGLIENVPLDEGTQLRTFLPEGAADDAGVRLSMTFQASDYFKTMGISVLAGRALTEQEELSGQGLAIVSKSAADRLWPGQDPMGRRFQLQGSPVWLTVSGVVEDVMQYGFRDEAQSTVYLPLVGPTPDAWRLSSPAYVIKTTRAEVIAPEVRALAKEVAPEAPMYRVYTMEELARRSMVSLSFTMLTLGVIAALALILGAVGLYGVLSYIVAERTREIGVRMALGAQASQVRTMVVSQGARVVLAGIVIGLVVAFAATRALSSLLFGVQAIDLTTFAGMSLMMIAVGLLASYLPARRASSVDPNEALREG